jgi:hypothetical protein
VVPFPDAQEVKLSRVQTDRGTECRGAPERHECELCLAVEDIDHSRPKTESPRTNGIVERLHETVPDEFHRVALRKRVHPSVEEPQADLDAWIGTCNEARGRQGRRCTGQDADGDVPRGRAPRAGEDDRRPIATRQAGPDRHPDARCPIRSELLHPTPQAPASPAMPARVPFAFAADLDAGAVHEQVQRPLAPLVGELHRQRPLAASSGSVLWRPHDVE